LYAGTGHPVPVQIFWDNGEDHCLEKSTGTGENCSYFAQGFLENAIGRVYNIRLKNYDGGFCGKRRSEQKQSNVAARE